MALANGGICVQVYQTGESCRTGRADQDPEELRGVTQGLGVRSILAVPLAADSARRGVLQAHAAQPDKFTADDLAFLESVARWIGMVLHRAELVEQLAREAADKARQMAADELVTILAHDLRGPLTPLRGYLGLIRQEVKRAGLPASVRYAETSLRAVERLQSMITNLLDTARLEEGIFGLERQPVDVAGLAIETARGLEAGDAPIRVRGPAVALIEGDPERIRQVLENLLSNARKHSPKGAEIVVEVDLEQRDNGVWAVVTVRDSGPGIPPEMLPRLFTRFVRGDESQGLGLGLFLARGIAEAHGGTLTVDSRPGQGTAFRLALPGANETYS
jgi:signal transduction histidine kinase